MMIQTKMAMWWTWARIAARELGAATRARAEGAPAWKFESEDSASLSAEFERSLTAIAACAFSMEAMSKELIAAGHDDDYAPTKPDHPVSKGYYVGCRIRDAFAFEGELGARLPGELSRMFTLRNDAVHFESTWQAGAHAHPRGGSTAYEITLYTLEEARKCVNLLHETFMGIQATRALGKHGAAGNYIAQEIASVHSMFDEVLRVEGVELDVACADG